MTSAYSSEPINFENIVSNRPSHEVTENTLLLITFFYEYGLNTFKEYFKHNDVECEEDLIYKGFVCSLNTFFNQDNVEELQNYIEDFRQSKINSKPDVIDEEDEISDDDDGEDLEKNRSCNCNFCQSFNNSENILNNFNPTTNSEFLIKEVLNSDSPREYIRNIYLNPALYE
jgi:hypothetical protein